MIAKRIPRRLGTSSTARLVRYMMAANGDADPSTWKRTADYILDTRGTTGRGEKIASFRVANCETDDPAVATTMIEAVQAKNRRSKADKTYHLVFSFPPGERPAADVLHAIEDELCAAIGFADHQRISAVHQDTDHLHVHVAINKVCQTTLRNIEPYYDQQKLMAACEELEIRYGLARTDHGLSGERKQSTTNTATRAAEAHRGEETLLGRLQRQMAPALRQATSWQAVHDTLRAHGLVIRLRGAGLVIGSPEAGLWCKVSNVGRDLSKARLEARMGAFTPDKADARVQASAGVWKPRPVQRHPESSRLWNEYQQQRQAAKVARGVQLAAVRAEQARRRQHVRQKASWQRAAIRVSGARGIARRLLSLNVRRQTQAARQRITLEGREARAAVNESTPLPSWQSWLIAKAERGDNAALAVLRSREPYKTRRYSNHLSTRRRLEDRTDLLRFPTPRVRGDGAVSYRTADGGMVLDRGQRIEAAATTEGSILLSLQVAAERFSGQALKIEGTREFREGAARIAAEYGLQLRFADAGLERLRLSQSAGHGNPAVAARWIEWRNATRQKVQGLLLHRLWQPEDSGRAIYRGQRQMQDGSMVLLLERAGQMLVKPASERQAGAAKSWKTGQPVHCRTGSVWRGRDRENDLGL